MKAIKYWSNKERKKKKTAKNNNIILKFSIDFTLFTNFQRKRKLNKKYYLRNLHHFLLIEWTVARIPLGGDSQMYV